MLASWFLLPQKTEAHQVYPKHMHIFHLQWIAFWRTAKFPQLNHKYWHLRTTHSTLVASRLLSDNCVRCTVCVVWWLCPVRLTCCHLFSLPPVETAVWSGSTGCEATIIGPLHLFRASSAWGESVEEEWRSTAGQSVESHGGLCGIEVTWVRKLYC